MDVRVVRRQRLGPSEGRNGLRAAAGFLQGITVIVERPRVVADQEDRILQCLKAVHAVALLAERDSQEREHLRLPRIPLQKPAVCGNCRGYITGLLGKNGFFECNVRFSIPYRLQ